MIDFSKFELSKSDADAFQSLVGPEGLWKKKQLDQLKLIQEVGLSHTDSVLELGCGPIRFGCGLIDYLNTGCYQGIDIREESISQANLLVKKFDLNNKSPFLSTSDDFGLDVIQKDSIDFIWAFNVLIHLSEPLLIRSFYAISKLLKIDGRAIFTIRISKEQGFKKTGEWQDYPISCASFDYLAEVADECGLIFSLFRPISSLTHANKKQSPCYYLAGLRHKQAYDFI